MKPSKRLPALLAALTLALSCAACGASGETAPPPSPAKPSAAAATFEPRQAETGSHARIVMYTMFSSSAYDGVAERVNQYLADAGQTVKIALLGDPYGGRSSDLVDKLGKEFEAGKPSADAYALDPGAAKTLFSGGYVLDPTVLLTANAPDYRARYAKLFPEPLYGIPVNLYGRPLVMRPALVLRQEIEPTVDTGTIDGFLDFLDRDVRTSPMGWQVVAQPNELVNQWALEQGYYSLDWFNIKGGFYMKLDDDGFTPVPLERLPGFADFVRRLTGYYNGGPLITMGEQGMGASPAGMVKNLGEYHILNPLVSVSAMGGQFTAYPFTADLPAVVASPDYMNMLVVPAACPQDKAVAIARFIEWLYGSQENYDVLAYGKKGVDFADEGGRFRPLLDGKPVQALTGETMTKVVFLWPGAEVFGNNDLLRLPYYAPDNLDQLLEREPASGRKLPMQRALAERPGLKDRIEAVNQAMMSAIAVRSTAISDLLMTDSPDSAQLEITMGLLTPSDADLLASSYAKVLQDPAQ